MRKFKLTPKSEPVEKAEPECAHDWKRFKETVTPQERNIEQLRMGLEWKGLAAYFTVKACLLCKKKQYLDYKVER